MYLFLVCKKISSIWGYFQTNTNVRRFVKAAWTGKETNPNKGEKLAKQGWTKVFKLWIDQSFILFTPSQCMISP